MYTSNILKNEGVIILSSSLTPRIFQNENIKYNICTVANDCYSNFLYYFVKSALEKCKNMSELIILYTGEKINDDPIFKNEKVKIVKLNENIKTNKIWDVGWQKNIDLKTQFLRSLAVKHTVPIFLVDVDSYFVDDFINLIDLSKDICVTYRPQHFKPYIASFVGLIKPKKCLAFIDIWRNEMRNINYIPKETIALINTISFVRKNVKIDIQEINESVISCLDQNYSPKITKIIHFKGGSIKGNITDLLSKRIKRLENIINHV